MGATKLVASKIHAKHEGRNAMETIDDIEDMDEEDFLPELIPIDFGEGDFSFQDDLAERELHLSGDPPILSGPDEAIDLGGLSGALDEVSSHHDFEDVTIGGTNSLRIEQSDWALTVNHNV